MSTQRFEFRNAGSGAPAPRSHLRLADLVYGPWALIPEHLLELQAIYETHLRGDKIDIAAIEARLGRPLSNEQRHYEVTDGVAVLPVQGVISPKANLMTQISGGASAQMLIRQVQSAMADPQVRSMILATDSPGGNVLGTPELAQAVRDFSAVKPVVTHTDGQLASAAYWVGSAANGIYISGPTVQVGSIGVVATHRDMSAAEAKAGVKTTHITAGKYKRLASSSEPLSDEGRASIQEQIDYVYGLFVDTVAENRGASVEQVLEHMADGRTFIGQQAINAGLVDGVSTLDALIEQLASDPGKFATRKKARIASSSSRKPSSAAGAAAEDNQEAAVSASSTDQPGAAMPDPDKTPTPAPLTLEAMRRDHGALYAEIMTAGAAAERDRVKGVREQLIPGHEALVEALVADGKTTPDQAARAVNAAERNAREAAAKAHKADAPPAAASDASAAASDVSKLTKAEQVAKAKAYAADKGVTFIAAMKALGFAD